MLDLAGIDLKDVNIDDIDPSLFAPIAGLNSKELTVRQIGAEGVDDMIVLDDLDENMILANLKARYNRDAIYVRTPLATQTNQQTKQTPTGHFHFFFLLDLYWEHFSGSELLQGTQGTL